MKEKILWTLAVIAFIASGVLAVVIIDARSRLAVITYRLAAMETEIKTNTALITAHTTESAVPLPPVVTETEWRAAWNSVPACGGLEQKAPDTETLKTLGFQRLIDQGFAAARVCRDVDIDHVAFIFAKEALTSAGPGAPPACVDYCDQVVFGVISGESKSLRYLESGSKLGLYAGNDARYCLLDKILDAPQHGPEQILFYCGPSASGGLTDWYHYDFRGDKLTAVQTVIEKGPPERFEVKDAELLKLFFRQSN